jgi:N-methylhydantoinase A
MSVRIGVDIGGTFTDAVAIADDGTETTAKSLSTPPNLARGVMAAVAGLGVELADVDTFVHGTTAGLNAFLERRGARVALVTTRGFRDVYEIGRANRPAMYDVRYRQPAPLVERKDVFEVDERMAADGSVLRALRTDQVAELAGRLASSFDAVAIVLLHAYANAAHELEVARIFAERAPNLVIVASHDVAPEWREYERTSTTVVSAYIAPIVGAYLGLLEQELAANGCVTPLRVMQSNGGVMTAAIARAKPIQTLLSGPVGGTVAGVAVAGDLGLDRLICIDMGGTSFDVSLVVDGGADLDPQASLEGHPMLTPAVAIHTVGAGGGSVAFVEAGALRVGPRSAGADPGPACYRQGGTEPTVTDANVVLGRLPAVARMGGTLDLDVDAAAAAVDTLAHQLGLDRIAAARGIVAVADAAMANAIREITVSHGIDPRDFSLLAFGGAGPLHAISIAEELEITSVVVPANPGVLSAWGMLHTDTRHDLVQSFFTPIADASPDVLGTAIDELGIRARRLLADDGVEEAAMELIPSADLRYVGQEYSVGVAWSLEDDLDGVLACLPDWFGTAHLERYGHNNPDERIECVNLRMTAVGRIARAPARLLTASGTDSRPQRVAALLDGDWRETEIHRREDLPGGTRVHGPAIVLEDACTTVVSSGWSGVISSHGHLTLERGPDAA